MPRPLAVAFALLLASAAPAETPHSVEHIPAVERPQTHFYGAIGGAKRLEVRWEVSPASVPFGDSFTLTLVVAHAVNPHELTHPPLLDFADFRALFSAAQELPAETGPTGEATLRYKVTPRNEGPARIPELKYNYYQPNISNGSKTQTVRALAVPFTVSKPPVVPGTPLDAPGEFFELRNDGPFTRSGGPSGWVWAGLVVAAVGVGAVWVLVWRWKYPDAARLAAIRRNRAVRIALDRLRRPKVTPEEVAVTVRNYLIARFGLAFTAQTPAEVSAGLTEVGVSAERAAEAEGLLREFDAARFAGATDRPVSASRAAAMIERWEQ